MYPAPVPNPFGSAQAERIPKMFKKKDLYLIAVLALVAGGLLFLLPHLQKPALPPADGLLYLRYTVNGQEAQVLPLTEETDLMISQEEEKTNVLHLTPNGFSMASSTCHNQLCVLQGEVTLKNMEERPLFHMVVCAPHRIVAELLTQPPEKEMLP